MICGEVIDALCARPGVALAAGFRTRGHLRDPDLSVALPDHPFRVTRVPLRLARDAERGGEVGLAFADPPPEERPAPAALPRADLMGCRAEMVVALPTLSLPWARVAGLSPGDALPLPEDALGAVRLSSIDGTFVAGGRLGRLGDLRAVRLLAPPSEAPEGGVAHPGADPLPSLDAPDAEVVWADRAELPDLPDLPDPAS